MKKFTKKLLTALSLKFKMINENQQGIGSIEMVLILLVLVGLIVVFR